MNALLENDPFAELEIPEPLQQSLARHRDHLAQFVMSLRSAGLSETQIEMSVSVMVESYKQELLLAIKALVR